MGAALVLKLAMRGIALLLLLPWLFRVSLGAVRLTAIAIWIGSLVVGDLWVLPRMGQGAAAVADFILVARGIVLPLGVGFTWRLLAVGLAVTAEEAFLHQYLASRGIAGHPAPKP